MELHMCVFIHQLPFRQDFAFQTLLLILRNTLELTQSLLARSGARLTSGKGPASLLVHGTAEMHFYGFDTLEYTLGAAISCS